MYFIIRYKNLFLSIGSPKRTFSWRDEFSNHGVLPEKHVDRPLWIFWIFWIFDSEWLSFEFSRAEIISHNEKNQNLNKFLSKLLYELYVGRLKEWFQSLKVHHSSSFSFASWMIKMILFERSSESWIFFMSRMQWRKKLYYLYKLFNL